VDLNRDRLAEAVVARCRNDRLEPPTPGRNARLVQLYEACAQRMRTLRGHVRVLSPRAWTAPPHPRNPCAP
jgi:hypothetical protein